MTTCMQTEGAECGRLGSDAIRLLALRNTLDKNSLDFAVNRHFGRLCGGWFDNAEKPVVLFTSCPHDLSPQGKAATKEFLKWAEWPRKIAIGGRSVDILGLDRVSTRPTLLITKCRRSCHASDILMYREFHSDGLYECGTSCLFFGSSIQEGMELCLCYLVGEFWAYLAHLSFLYRLLGLGGSLPALMSIRNSRNLTLGNYGDEALGPSWYDSARWPRDLVAPTTSQKNIQLQYNFNPADQIADWDIAQAARDAAARICNAYDAGAPRCYNDGVFAWRLWKHTRQETVGGNQT